MKSRTLLPKWALQTLIISAACAITIGACGKPDSGAPSSGSDQQTNAAAPGADPDGMIPVNGVARFGNECPYGWSSEPFPAKLQLWQCPIGLSQLDLAEPIQPVILQADCRKKTLTIRTQDRSIDQFWNVMPDGSFDLAIEGLSAKLKSDGNGGNTNCTTPVVLDITGNLNCADPDKANITFDAVFWLGKKTFASPSPSPSPSVSPSPSPSPTPSPTPSPSITPSPTHSVGPNPVVTITPRPISIFSALTAAATDSTIDTGTCKLPDGCYLYTNVTVKQCQ